MKTRTSTISALLLAGMLTLSACSSGSSGAPQSSGAAGSPAAPASSASSGAAEGKTDIKVWTKDRHDQEFMTALISKFNADNPDINVIYEMYTDNYQQTVEIAASTGELPDILAPTQPVTNNLIARDQFLYIDEYMSAEFKANFDESLFVEGVNMHEGKIFSLPSTGTCLRLVYNKGIFEKAGIAEPPKTVADMVADAKLITEKFGKEGVYGFALPMKNPKSGLQRGFTQIAMLSGSPVIEGFDLVQGKYDFSCYKPIVEALTEIWSSGAAFPGCESLEIDPLRTQFAAGKIGMYMTYNHSEWGVYTKQFPTEEEWAYAMLPTLDGTVAGSQKLSAGTWYAMTKSCKDPEKGWRVLEAIYNLDGLTEYYEKGLGVTVLDSAMKKAKAPESIAYTPLMGIQPSDKIWPLEPVAVIAEGDDWGKGFGDIIFGGRLDLDKVIEDLNTRYNAAYEKSIAAGSDVKIQYPSFKASDPAGTMK